MADEKRRLPIRKREITISDGDYAGWTFTAVTNPPLRVIEDLSHGELSTMVRGLVKIICAPWNFVDVDGNPMSDPSEETIRDLPIDLIGAIAGAYVKEQTTLPPA